MATPPGGGGEVPQAGYYPDPSIPGYIRYWNGGAWVPGTSRPAPKEGEALPAPPVSVAPQLAPSPAPAPQLPSVPAVEETGPLFFDEEPEPSAPAQEPATAWHATTSLQTGFGGERDQKVSWGRPDEPAPARESSPQEPPAQELPADPRSAAAAAWPQAEAAAADPRTADPRGAEPHRAEPHRAAPEQAAARAPETPQAPRTPRTPRPLPAQGPVGAPETSAPVWPAAGGPADPQAAVPAQSAPAQSASAAPAVAAGAGQAPAATPARLGGMPVTPSWSQQPQAPQAQAQPPQAVQPQAQPQLQPQPQPQQAQQPHPSPHIPQPQQPQQAHQPQQAAQDPQPVLPWKPPVEDVFTSAARAQAAARPAGLGKRLVARLVDTLLLGAVVGAVSYPFVMGAIEHIDGKIEAAKQSGVTVQVWLIDSTTSVQFGIVLAAFLVLGALYEALPTAKWGRTLGKKLCGIEVRDIEAHEPPTFGAALRRWLVYGVLGLIALGVLNVLWCLFDRPWRQCWHDKAARTFVAG
ncbi:RDD family protein [Streptomyces sp. NPDC013740]|uniref:RDD family protein n=1 Tax=Streptomyces sp. NPDC013740 TaxID=3364867 RepID=UPI0036FCCECD